MPAGGKPAGRFTDISTCSSLANQIGTRTDPLLGNDLVSQGCPKADPAVVGRPVWDCFHRCCVNSAGFRYILAACPNRSLVKEEVRPKPHSPMPFAMARRGIVEKPQLVSTPPMA